MTTIHRTAVDTAGAAIASGVRKELLARKRVGKNGLPFHMVREDQIKTRWTEVRRPPSKVWLAPCRNTAAIRGFLAMFAESPEMLAHVHRELTAAGLSIPDWLPPLPGRATR